MFDISKKIDKLAACKPARRKGRRRRALSLHEEVLSLVQNANVQVAQERHVTPRSALTVMKRTISSLSSLDEESRRIGVLREVNRFISLQHDTQRAHVENTEHADLLPMGHPLSSLNAYQDSNDVRRSYATWLAADSSVPSHLKVLVSSAFASEPFSLERKHAFTRLNLSKDANVPLFFKLDPIVAAFTFRGGNSSAARRARVALQWRDRRGRWVEMGRGIDFNFRLPNGDIATAGGSYVGVNAARGYSSENGKPVANAGLVEIRGDANIPDGIYSIESANANPVKARVPGEALKRAKVKATPDVRKPTAEESQSKDIPNINDILKTRVDAPSGWEKQNDGSFLSDDDYKAIPTDTGYSLHRLDKNGNTGDKVADVSSWAEVQAEAEKDSNDYDKFKESVGIKDQANDETRQGIEQARAVQDERKATIPSDTSDESLIPDNVGTSGELPNGVTYTAEDKQVQVAVFPGRYAPVDGVRVALAGDTYPNRENIKKLGFKWNNADKIWYKNFIDSDLLGSSHNTTRIREQLDGIGGGAMPRYAGDNGQIESVIQDARNKMIDHYRATEPEQQDRAKEVADILYEAGRELGNRAVRVIPNNNEDRVKARAKLKEFLDIVETDDLFQSSDVERAKERTRDAITLLDEKIGDTSDKEKPPAVAKEDKPAQKVVSNSPLSAPALFDEFDAPRGAFQLRTIEYEAEGRIDQESSDYTDDPDRLATKYPLPELVRALTEAMIGEKEDSILSDILDASIGDDDESLDLEELNDVADTPAPQAGRANGTGAGSLEFNAGSEFIPAEALYNAVFKAGGDPNRVIANAYDAIHGDRRNLEKLTQASGDLPSPEEQQLVDDIMQEIRQIKDATPDGESPVSNAVSEPDEEPLPGKILNNIPIDWDNPDYYVLDPNQYVPTVPEPDENGYSDNPEFLARYYETADLIQQLETAIADGSGSTYLYFGNEDTEYMEGVFEVPVEAIRDALQLQDVNTNTLLENIKNEANNMEEPEVEAQAPTPEAAETPQEPTAEVSMDNAIKAMRDFYSEGVLRRDIKPLMYLPRDGSIAFKDSWDDLTIALPDGSIRPLNVTEEWLRDPNGAGQAGWRELTEEEKRNIVGAPQAAPAQPEPTPAAEPVPAPAPEAPRFQYPGPRESGYSPNNTTMVRNGAIVGRGSRVVAVKDGKTGTVVAIQNDPEYLRIRFDDGTTAVRAAAKVKALSDPSGAAPTAVAPAEEQKPAQGIERRLDRPKAQAPRVARSGDTVGVNDESTMPQWLNGLTNDAATQADFAAWGSRDAEIAKAARERISLDNLETQLTKIYTDRVSGTPEERRAADRLLTEIMGDIYGARNGITFGGEFFSVTATSASISASLGNENYGAVSPVDAQEGKLSYTVSVNMDVRDATGNKVGDVRRILSIKKKLDENKNVVSTDVSAKNEYLAISGGGKKKKGFATAFNRYSENWYIANGASSVKVYAAGGGQYQGGFVWALNGFNWDPSYGRPGVNIGDFQREMKSRDEEAQVEYLKEKIAKAKKPNGDIDYATYPTPLEFALVGWYPGAKDWIGKRVMVRNSWNGIKVLKPEAREQVQAANYAQIKNAERRIESKQNIPNLSSSAQTLVESDPFRNNSIIAPYFGEIRDALKNNRSLAVLSPDAKNALNAYVSEQILDKNRSLSLEDAFRLRNGLGNEYRADYGYSDPFNSAEVLSTFTTEDFIKASKQEEYTDLNAAGFTVRQLGFNEGGVNSTFEVTHVASGQVFFVKNEEFAARFSNVPGGVTELEAITLLRAAGMQGIHDVRIGRDDKNLVIMSRAGSTIPLVKEAINAGDAFRRGLKDAEGKINVDLSDPSELIKALDTPEDIVRMSLFDIIGNNQDRHNGNWMMAYDKVTGKIRVFPVDNTIGFLEKEQDRSAILEYLEYGNFNEADVYSSAMPQLISALGTDGLIKMYDNEIKNIISNLDNPLYQPKGFEMDAIIAKWGSYDAFKDAMAKRLQTLTTQGTDEYNAFKAALRLGYWS